MPSTYGEKAYQLRNRSFGSARISTTHVRLAPRRLPTYDPLLFRAVNERYRTRLEPDVAAQMHVRGMSDQITAVKLVGNEQIAKRQSKIDQLEDVHVSDMRVNGIHDDDICGEWKKRFIVKIYV